MAGCAEDVQIVHFYFQRNYIQWCFISILIIFLYFCPDCVCPAGDCEEGAGQPAGAVGHHEGRDAGLRGQGSQPPGI